MTLDEIAYLYDASKRDCRRTSAAQDVVWSCSGGRPWLDDETGNASAVTRDSTFAVHMGGAPLLTVFGGKITIYRKLAAEAVDILIEAGAELQRIGLDWQGCAFAGWQCRARKACGPGLMSRRRP